MDWSANAKHAAFILPLECTNFYAPLYFTQFSEQYFPNAMKSINLTFIIQQCFSTYPEFYFCFPSLTPAEVLFLMHSEAHVWNIFLVRPHDGILIENIFSPSNYGNEYYSRKINGMTPVRPRLSPPPTMFNFSANLEQIELGDYFLCLETTDLSGIVYTVCTSYPCISILPEIIRRC
jgi:hypothetical protein